MQVTEHLCHYGNVTSAVHHFIGKAVAQEMGTLADVALTHAGCIIDLIYHIADTDGIVLPVTVL